jgi:hypothetical protein
VRVSEHLQKEESAQILLNASWAEFEPMRELANAPPRSCRRASAAAEDSENRKRIALQLRERLSATADELFAAHRGDSLKLNSDLAPLEKAAKVRRSAAGRETPGAL